MLSLRFVQVFFLSFLSRIYRNIRYIIIKRNQMESISLLTWIYQWHPDLLVFDFIDKAQIALQIGVYWLFYFYLQSRIINMPFLFKNNGLVRRGYFSCAQLNYHDSLALLKLSLPFMKGFCFFLFFFLVFFFYNYQV
jgi:hypothetical protein